MCYDHQGISIIEVELSTIKKLRDGTIMERKKSKLEKILSTDYNFEDTLEIYGFEVNDYKCYKY